MNLNFNLDDIKYLKLEYVSKTGQETIKLALKEKRENEFIAVMPIQDIEYIETPQKVALSFICHDGLYKTITNLRGITKDDEFIYFELQNPDTLDYQQNRNYYRTLAEYDCVYTIEVDGEIESFNAVTYDISAGGVSIISSENIVPTRETSIVIFMPERDLKSHLKFVRCEIHEDNEYKLSFEFTDLSDRDYKMLCDLCVNKQISSF